LRFEDALGEWVSASVQALAQLSGSARFAPLNGSLSYVNAFLIDETSADVLTFELSETDAEACMI